MSKIPQSNAEQKKSSQQLHIERLENRKNALGNFAATCTNLINSVIASFDSNKYLFEVLQNISDATEQDRTTANLNVYKVNGTKYLVVSHDGRHFTEDDVETICEASSPNNKKLHDTKKIGHKDIGFKSIFSISNCVAIFSGGYQFRFENPIEDKQSSLEDKQFPHSQQQYPWQLIPIWTERDSLPDSIQEKINFNHVNFVIKVLPDTPIINHLNYFISHPTPMLFLQSIKKINISYPKTLRVLENGIEKNKVFYKTEKKSLELRQSNQLNQLSYGLYINDQAHSFWLVSSYRVTITEEVSKRLDKERSCPARLKEAKETIITFAAALDLNNSSQLLGRQDNRYLYCYLPTDVDFGLPYLVNADFLLNQTRSQLTESPWNQFLINRIGFAQILWIAQLSKNPMLRFQILTLFARRIDRGIKKIFRKKFKNGLSQALQTIRFIPPEETKSNKSLTFNEAVWDTTEFFAECKKAGYNIPKPSNLISHQLKHTSRLELPKNRVLGIAYVAKYLPTFVNHTSNIEHLRFCSWLLTFFNKNLSGWKAVLSDTAFIPNQHKQLVAPKQIFVPLSAKKINIPTELSVSCLHTKLLGYQQYDKNILYKLGAKKLKIKALFRNTIQPLIKNSGLTRENIIPITRYIFKLVANNQLSKHNIPIPKNMDVLTRGGAIVAANLCLLSTTYAPDTSLEHEIKSDIFISDEYLDNQQEEKKQDSSLSDQWYDFFLRIGVREAVYFENKTLTIAEGKKLYGETFDDYLDYLSENKGGQPHQRPRKIDDRHTIYGFLFCNIITHIHKLSLAKLFWKAVLDNWCRIKKSTSTYKDLRGKEYIIEESYISYAASETKCIPDEKDTLHAPADIYPPSYAPLKKYIPIVDIPGFTDEHADYFYLSTFLELDVIIRVLTAAKTDTSLQKPLVYSIIFKSLLDIELGRDEKGQLQQPDFKMPTQNGQYLPASQLHCYDASNEPAPSQGNWLMDEFKDTELNRNTIRRISRIFKIPIVRADSITYAPLEQKLDDQTHVLIHSRLSLIARVQAQLTHANEKKVLPELHNKHKQLQYFTTTEIKVNYGYDRAPGQTTAILQNTMLYYRGNWGDALTIDKFCIELSGYLGLSSKCSKHLRTILTIENNGVPRFLKHYGFKSNIPLVYMDQMERNGDTLLHEEVHAYVGEPGEIKNNLTTRPRNKRALEHTDETPTRISKQRKKMTVTSTERKTDKSKAEEKGETTGSTPLVRKKRRRERDGLSITRDGLITTATCNDRRKRQKTSSSSAGDSAERKEAKLIDISQVELSEVDFEKFEPPTTNSNNSPDEKKETKNKNTPSSTRTNNVPSEKTRLAIGKWGEQFVFKYLYHHYRQKYPNCARHLIENGFKLVGQDTEGHPLKLEVIWENKHGESGLPYDFRIIKNGKERYVEVKSTKSRVATYPFFMSAAESKVMREKKDRYRIFRVFKTGTANPAIKKFKNPAKLIEQGSISQEPHTYRLNIN